MLGTIVFIMIALVSLCIGLFIFINPTKAFEIQKKFYALINWRIEPISIEKEIRNTKVMGIFLIVFVLASCFYYWLR
jgi:hypothetical protein